MNKSKDDIKHYLYKLYPKAADQAMVRDLLRITDFPDGIVQPENYVGQLKDVINAGYTDRFFEAAAMLNKADGYHNIKAAEIHKDFSFVQEGVYLDRVDILELCEAMNNPRDRAILLGEFEGLNGTQYQELLEIKPEDIQKNGTIYIKSRADYFDASSDLIRYLKEAREQKEYIYLKPTGREETVRLTDNGTMLKELSKGKSTERRLIYLNLVRAGNVLGFGDSVSYRHIRNCGKKYYLEQLAHEYELPVDRALKMSVPVREKFMRQFGINGMIGVPKLMAPIDKLITRTE